MRLGKDVIATDLYRVLGVPKNATADQVRRAYRLQAMTTHPDLSGDERGMVELNVAAFVLLDAARRAEYDRQRALSLGQPSCASAAEEPEPADWYPWGSSPSNEIPEWSPPIEAAPTPLDPETRTELGRWRGGPERSFHQLLDWSASWPPGAHLAVTFTSICLALLLIAAAKPTSLPGFNEKHSLACVQDGAF